MSEILTSGGQSIRVSASTSALPMNIQESFPLGWTDVEAETPIHWPPDMKS